MTPLSITIQIYRLVGWSVLQFSIISAVLNWEIDAGMQKGSIEMQFDRLECLRSTPLLQCPRNRELKSSEVDFKDRLPPCKKVFGANLIFVPLSLTSFDPDCPKQLKRKSISKDEVPSHLLCRYSITYIEGQQQMSV